MFELGQYINFTEESRRRQQLLWRLWLFKLILAESVVPK